MTAAHADAPHATRFALRVLQAGAFLIVLAAVPYRTFDLDRHTIPKELVLHLTALAAALATLSGARRLTVFLVDLLLAGFLVVSALSALLATNGWLGFRALGVSVSGALLFWSARAVARAGHSRELLAALGAAIVLGALTALAQAYGLVSTSLASLSRAPGGTFGNRNFMAHLVAIGLPTVLMLTFEARDRFRVALGALATTLLVAALFLSRSRAAWLGAGLSAMFLGVEGFWIGRLWDDLRLRRRLFFLGGVALAGILAALALPNRLAWRSDSPYLNSLTGITNYREGSGRGRLIQYGNSLRLAWAHPLLGVGPGNWPVYYPTVMSPSDPSFDPEDFIPTNPWPSSDWVAWASERGLIAMTIMGLVGAALALAAWARVRHAEPARTRRRAADAVRGRPALQDLAIVATLIAVAVVGLFDAVLLLPVPTFFAWTIVGALASSARPVRELGLSPATQRWTAIALGLAGGLLVLRSATQVAAMHLYEGGGRTRAEWAARVDSGSYRIHMLLAFEALKARRCDRARPHARAAGALFPNHPAPGRIIRACAGRRR